ncbi:efflux RND transporter periplasmic adaptor subunit [Enterovibrio norvegicus]|uniref:efflux RND transporter periplasmic adaptor subunit n=1 Tax=Enterovibrio norvegicus TaxID=188144 RepID=UPI0013D72BDE|nr:efflux RND transporter periplasmic adaptor subunit [Enterovibrio norvegicus]
MERRHPLFIMLLSTLFLSACNSQAENKNEALPDAAPTVNVMTVNMAPTYAIDREYVGTVQAGQTANLGFELGGKVNELLVNVGDRVKKGAALLSLDTQLLDTEAQQLTAQLEQLDAQLDLTQTNLQRQRQLKKKGFSADSDIDSLISQRDALRANVRQLQASLSSTKLRKEKSTMYAPYSGLISERFVSRGDVVNVGAPTLTLLADTQKEAHIGVPVKQLFELSQREQPQVRIGESLYDVTLLNPGAAIDMRSRTVMLRYLLPEDTDVLSGQLAYLQFETQNPGEGFWVPLTGLTDGLRGTWNVYAAVENEDGVYQIARRSVQVLHADSDKAYVSGAVKDGEKVVSDGIHRIVSGQRVKLAAE